MLKLTRNIGQRVFVGDDIEVIVLGVNLRHGKPQVQLGFAAPKDVTILREEVENNNTKKE